MQEYGHLTVLVVDPNQGMRTSLQNMLNLAGIHKIEYAVNANTAIRMLARRGFDIIVCEYDLASGNGEGQDGQQLLEDLRHHQLIAPATIFIMLTAEGIYDKVVSAAELSPTDYVLKPFTVDMLSSRIQRALERRNALLPAWQLAAQGKLAGAIEACREGEEKHPRFALDFARLRAELHASQGDHPQAEALYRRVLDERPLGWAALGLARAMLAQGQHGSARAILEQILQSNPRLMAAYDVLARCLEMDGETDGARKVLEDAVAISPHVVRRLRKLGEVALATGDTAGAEKSFRQVVTKARYSEFRDPEDHVNLVKALVTRGDLPQAGGVIRDMERSLRGDPAADTCRAYANALVQAQGGNATAAAAEFANAAEKALKASPQLSTTLKLELARACLQHRLDEQASSVMLTVMNKPDSGVSMDEAMDVFVKAGRNDLVNGLGQQLRAQAKILHGLGLEKLTQGDVRGAVQTLLEALHLAPRNLIVMASTADAILRQADDLGWDHPLGETAGRLIDELRQFDAQHPQLASLSDQYQGVRRKYGIAAA